MSLLHCCFVNPKRCVTDLQILRPTSRLVESDRPGLAKRAAHDFGVAPGPRAPATQSHVMETEPPCLLLSLSPVSDSFTTEISVNLD